MTPREILDEFGKDVVVASRDSVIFCVDAALEQTDSPPNSGTDSRIIAERAEEAVLARLPPEIKKMIRGFAIRAVDDAIFEMLLNLGDLSWRDDSKLLYRDVDMLRVTPDGLNGRQFLEDGWFARFSKYGEHPHTPAEMKTE